MDFSAIAKYKQIWDQFTANHPKIPGFINAVYQKKIPVGSEVFVSITYPNGQNIKASIIVKDSDLELMESLKQMKP